VLQQQDQDVEGLRGEGDVRAVAQQQPLDDIDLEPIEVEEPD
jgi:hypothetical protein